MYLLTIGCSSQSPSKECCQSTRTDKLFLNEIGDVHWHLLNLGGVESSMSVKPAGWHIDDWETHCSMSRIILTSSLVTKLIDTPLRPNRPPRPIRWM